MACSNAPSGVQHGTPVSASCSGARSFPRSDVPMRVSRAATVGWLPGVPGGEVEPDRIANADANTVRSAALVPPGATTSRSGATAPTCWRRSWPDRARAGGQPGDTNTGDDEAPVFLSDDGLPAGA